MKLKKIALAMLLLFTTVFLTAAGGTQYNPLIAHSWLEGEFRSNIMNEIDTALAGKKAEAEAKIRSRLTGSVALTPPAESENQYVYTPVNTVVMLKTGQILLLAQGTSFTVNSEVYVTLESGDLIDSTAGAVAAAVHAGSGAVTVNALHSRKYLLPEASSGFIIAPSPLTVYVKGWYAIETGEHAVFKDVMKIDWYYTAVDFVYQNGYFRGTAEDLFSPSGEMTRAMFATVLYRFAGQPEVSEFTPPMSDTSDPALYYYNAVRWGVASGIIRGYEDGTFRPDERVTREQMAALLYRYASHVNYGIYTDPGESETSNAENYPDWNTVSEYALDAFKWACASGVIRGSDGMLLPQLFATRAQVAQVIVNFAALNTFVEEEPEVTPSPDVTPDATPEVSAPVSPSETFDVTESPSPQALEPWASPEPTVTPPQETEISGGLPNAGNMWNESNI